MELGVPGATGSLSHGSLSHGSLSHGSLTWGVKQSLLDYLGALDDAELSGTRASDDPAAPFLFTEARTSSPEAPSYHGRMHLVAHGGELDIDLADPEVGRSDGGWTVAFRTASGGLLELIRLNEVEVEHERGLVVRRASDVALVIGATALFGGSYAPYTRMAPLTFSARLARG